MSAFPLAVQRARGYDARAVRRRARTTLAALMALIRPADRFRLRLLPAVLTFGAVVAAPAALEVREGRGPWNAWCAAPPTFAALRDGSAARRLEAAAEPRATSAFAAPRYREALWRAFGRLTPKLFAGPDGVLFETWLFDGYPEPDAAARAARGAALVRELAAHLEARGGRLLSAPVPLREDFLAARLPNRPDAPRGGYDALLAAWRDAGVPVVDLKSALAPLGESAFFRDDPHWTTVAARVAAEAAADVARGLVDVGALGTPEAFFAATSPPAPSPGGYRRMAGFRPGSPSDLALADAAPIVTVAAATGEPAADGTPRPIVVAGTSFSRDFGFPHYVAAALGRRVEQAAVQGDPFSALAARIVAAERGEKPWPALWIWEFPERAVFRTPAEFQDALEAFLAARRPAK
ncbi:MAG TPA: hypothetical protein VEI02_09590 [Planctomycetota bacterium]|nr:hypothetical protein [Planctomycetota bacterium]